MAYTKDIAWTPGPDSASRRAEAGRLYWRHQNERRDAERKMAHRLAAAEVGGLTDRELLLVGTALYWAEGTKAKPWRPSDERLRFINSDPDVIRLYLAWLKLLDVDRERVSYRVNIHSSADVEAAERYWAGIVGIAVEALAPPTLKRHKPRTVRKNTGDSYRGCMTIAVRGSTSEYRRMHGIWSGVARAAVRRVMGAGDES